MANLDIAETRLPQDGRIELNIGGNPVDLRVSTLPTMYGESVVMRILDRSNLALELEGLGLRPEELETMRKLCGKPNGIVLVTGPTGSGKTTTLYSALNYVNSPSSKIITVEDPVEYRLERINQVQINARIGLDFARVLRTALRQDPDVVLVGEMRDRETVEIGLRAAMTGHLVLSTLHTINAIATVNRLLDMGAQGYLIASALNGILAQRLGRRLCDGCTQPAELTPQQSIWLSRYLTTEKVAQSQFQQGAGCTYCNMTGYRGRVGVYELLEIDSALADAIRREDVTGFSQLARNKPNFVSLVQCGLDYAMTGVTSVEEVMRIAAGLEEMEDEGSDMDPVLEDVLGAADSAAG